MSRYQWPRRRKSPDRAAQRHAWNVATDGVVTEAAVLTARRTRATSAALRRLAASAPGARTAPIGTANLWLPIGPSVVVKGSGSFAPRVVGRVRDLAVSDNGKRAYAAAANGGVWFTGDEGKTWAPMGNWLPTPGEHSTRVAQTALTCGCLHVKFGADDDVDADEVYVGTGELRPSLARGFPAGALGGVGVLRLKQDAVPPMTTTRAVAEPFSECWEREAKNLATHGIYRLARDPLNDDTIVAATSAGVYSRSGPFDVDADWEWMSDGPLAFDADDKITACDVLWVQSGATSRLIVAIYGKRTGVYCSEGGLAGPFDPIRLPGLKKGRIALAWTAMDQDRGRLYVLGKGPKLYRVDFSPDKRPAVDEVTKLPPDLFGDKKHDQSDYDMALAISPKNSEMVYIGGSGMDDRDGTWNACLFRSMPGGGLDFGFSDMHQEHPENSGTWVGRGVHADVHRICLHTIGDEVHGWVACDGGVFRSPAPDVNGTWDPYNVGLAVLEGGYVASHPRSDQFVILGTQDNGVVQRVGDSVWLRLAILGDGGGVAFHPLQPEYFACQYTNAEWFGNDESWEDDERIRRSFAPPVVRGRNKDSEKTENEAALFYSGIDVQAVDNDTAARVAIGTNRVWVSEDWDPSTDRDNTWQTLPSGDDPRRGLIRNVRQDVPDREFGSVIAMRWARDHRLFVLHQRAVVIFTPPQSGTTRRWGRTVLTRRPSACRFDDADIALPSSPYLPPLGAWSDIALDHEEDGLTTCFVACTGYAELDDNKVTEATRMDTLWWHDGAGAWWPTALRNAIAAPAYAVLVDPDDKKTVYVGTALGVWRGSPEAGDAPKWDWTPINNGLPEAAVQDLSLYQGEKVKLLRAAIQARGVWELDLSATPSRVQCLFLRSHPNDARRLAPADLKNPTLTDALEWPWYVSPDVRIVEKTKTWAPDAPTEADLLEWSDSSGAVLIRRRTPDIVFAASDIQLLSPLGTLAAAYVVEDDDYDVHVLVHYRDLTALDAGAVSVTLLRMPLPATMDGWDGVDVAGALPAIADLLTAATPAPWDDAVGMVLADPAMPRRSPSGDVDARTPRAVTFDLDMRGVASGFHALLAVASATVDPVSFTTLPGTTLEELVLNSHHVGMRVLWKN